MYKYVNIKICIDIYGTYNTPSLPNNNGYYPTQKHYYQQRESNTTQSQTYTNTNATKTRPPTHDIAYNTNTCLLWTYN